MKTSPKDVSNHEILVELRALAKHVSERFDGVDERFEGIDTHLDGIDTRLVGIDARLDGIDTRLVGIDARFDGIDTRLVGIDARFDGIDTRLVGIDARFDEVLEVTNSFATDTERRLTAIEREQVRMRSNMVTKGYLDDKMADQYSDIVRHTKKEIEKALN